MLREDHPKTFDLAIPFLGVFYALVLIFNQISIYLYFSVALSLIGILWSVSENYSKSTYFSFVVALFLTLVGIYYHAVQPYPRSILSFVRGERTVLISSHELVRNGLWIEAGQLDTYTKLVNLIQKETKPDETIFVIANNLSIYFLTNRKNPFRFFNSAFGVDNEKKAQEVIKQLEKMPPKLVVYNPYDQYLTPAMDSVIDFIKRRYKFFMRIEDIEVFKY